MELIPWASVVCVCGHEDAMKMVCLNLLCLYSFKRSQDQAIWKVTLCFLTEESTIKTLQFICHVTTLIVRLPLHHSQISLKGLSHPKDISMLQYQCKKINEIPLLNHFNLCHSTTLIVRLSLHHSQISLKGLSRPKDVRTLQYQCQKN